MSEETKPACRNCKHRGLWIVLHGWNRTEDVLDGGKMVLETIRVECRRYAPVGERSISTFPLQTPQDLCGEWAPRDE